MYHHFYNLHKGSANDIEDFVVLLTPFSFLPQIRLFFRVLLFYQNLSGSVSITNKKRTAQ